MPIGVQKDRVKNREKETIRIRTAMTYDSIQNHRGRNKFHSKSQGRGRSSSSIRNCKYCGKSHNKGNCPAFGKKCGKDNHFKSVCKSGTDKCDSSRHRPKYKGKGKKFHEINEQSSDGVMDDLADQVKSLFYDDVHFEAVNTRMNTKIKCNTPDGQSSDQTFKVDTGANGNLMPITMFSKLFPKVSLDVLGRTIEKGITLYAYNNIPIKQYRTCNVKLTFRGRSTICKFFLW